MPLCPDQNTLVQPVMELFFSSRELYQAMNSVLFPCSFLWHLRMETQNSMVRPTSFSVPICDRE